MTKMAPLRKYSVFHIQYQSNIILPTLFLTNGGFIEQKTLLNKKNYICIPIKKNQIMIIGFLEKNRFLGKID